MKKIAIIGYGNIAKKHIEVFRALECEIIASCNRSDEKNKLAKETEGIPNIYTDYHKMIEETKPDGILVCVSFWNMFNVLKDIIPYGIPILSEKPTATSLDEQIELETLSEKHKTPVMVGFNRRHYSVLQKAIEALGGKDKITSVLIEWSENPNHLINNRKLTDEQIKQYYFGNTIHGLDLLTSLAGEINSLDHNNVDFNDEYRKIVNFSGKSDSNVIFNFYNSWNNPVPWRLVITSKDNFAMFAPLETCILIDNYKNQRKNIEPDEIDVKYKAGFYKQAKLFIDKNFEGNDLKSAHNSMKLADSLTRTENA